MSGAAEGVAGLALSAVSVAALFTTCVDCFNIAVTAREFGRDYELLCTELSLQKLRLFLWGESVGLAFRQENPGTYHPELDDPILKPTIVQTLRSIEFLLTETQKYDERYGAKENDNMSVRCSRGLSIFKSTFEIFKENTKKNQKQKSVLAVTRWAIFDREHFETKITRLRSFIDGLESVTKSLGALERQHNLLREEISSITDVESLELVRDASGIRDISDTASRRLSLLDRESAHSQIVLTLSSTKRTSNSDASFCTAPSSLDASSVSYPFIVNDMKDDTSRDTPLANLNETQNQRIMRSKLGDTFEITPQDVFDTSKYHAHLLAPIKTEDKANIGRFRVEFPDVIKGRRNRILKEWKNTFLWSEWVSITPICSDMSCAMASMEGPPESPYESGVFWLSIFYPKNYPLEPPSIKFLTRVYHPNIDSRGKICLDILSTGWSPVHCISSALASIHSLLTDPGLEDPLVPEIAQTYIHDYKTYCDNARAYTRKYATGERPNTSGLASAIHEAEMET